MSNESKLHKPEDLLSGVPNIGGKATQEREQGLIKQAIDEFIKVLDPIMNRMGEAITELQGRVGQVEDIVQGALVEILTEQVRKKLDLKNPHFESIRIGGKKELPKRAKEKTAEEKAWDGEDIKDPEGQLKEVKK